MEEATTPVSVRSVGIKYGMIYAGISIAFFLGLALTGMNVFDNTWGWVRLPISIVIIILAQKNFKDAGNGFMTFGQGFGVGFWVVLVSAVAGGLFTFLYVTYFDPGVMDTFYTKQMEAMQEKGMPDDQIEMAMGYTKKLFWPIFAVFGVLFSLVIPLIITIFTQKKNPNAEMM